MTDTNTLLDLHRQANIIEQQILENEGELTDEIESALMNVETGIADKLDGYGYVLDRMKAVETYWKEKAKLFQKTARSCGTVQSRIKERLKFVMEQAGQEVAEGNTVRFKLIKAKGRLVIGDEEAIPQAYKTPVTVYEIDKDAVRKAIEDGAEIPGAWIEGGTGLRMSTTRKELP